MIDLLSGPLSGRIRECASDNCALVCVDSSRPGARRWCAMQRCGNRDKLRRSAPGGPRTADAASSTLDAAIERMRDVVSERHAVGRGERAYPLGSEALCLF